MDIYLIRHGETTYNQEERIQGAGIDAPLAEEGIKGAIRIGQELKNIDFYQVYSSPMKRTMQTTSYILKQNAYWNKENWQQEIDLREIEFGDWEGKRILDIAHEKEFVHLRTQPHLYDPSSFGGENYTKLVDRASAVLQRIIRETPVEGKILIVAHGVILTSLIKYLQNYSMKEFRKDGLIRNTTINHLITNDYGKSFDTITYDQNKL